ncbi:MAG TPA: metallophosphoesterase, partial [Acidimicrobiales bacterium]
RTDGAGGAEAEAGEGDGDTAGDGRDVGGRGAAGDGRAVGERRSRWQTWRDRARVGTFALGGAVIALALAGRVPAKVGPFDTTMAVRPSWTGETVVRLAPLGTIGLDTHDWPLRLELRVDELGLDEAERIAEHPETVDTLGDDLADEVRAALVRLTVRCALLAVAGGVAGALAAKASWRSALTGLALGSLVVAGVGGGTAATFDPGAVAEPRYTGLLTVAPTAVGDVEDLVDRFGQYRAQLSDLVGNIVTLYLAAEGLPTFEPTDGMVRLLHVSDIHLNPQAFDLIEQVSDQFGVDAVVDTGDITDWGTGSEDAIVDMIGDLDVPYVWVRGNHDSRRTQRAVAAQPNAVVLDGEATEVGGLRIWGVGDPRYTPNKQELDDTSTEQERIERFAPEVAGQVADAEPPAIDVVMVHDARAAADLGGLVPLVLSGHTHRADDDHLDPPEEAEEDGDGDGDDRASTSASASVTSDGAGDAGADAEPEETLVLTEGSTGGAGLRGLQGEEPQPLTCTVLYFDPDTQRLVAYDRITVEGLGGAGATIERHVVGDDSPDPG